MARIDHLDTLKALAIYLVVLGHTIQGTDADFWHNGAFLLIYAVHMPLFAILSGYFFHADDGAWQTVRRKTVQLIVPCIAWGTLEMGVSIAQHVPEHYMNVIKPTVLYAQWFIKCMWVCSLLSLLPCLLPWANSVGRKMGVAVVLCLVLCLSGIGDVFWVNFLLPFFFVGIVLRHRQGWLQALLSRRRMLYVVLLTAVFAALYTRWDGNRTIYLSPIAPLTDGAIDSGNVMTTLLRWALGLVGCLAIILLSPWLHRCVPATMRGIVSWVGRRTKGIYIIHTSPLVALAGLNDRIGGLHGGGYVLSVIALSVMVTLVATLITWVLERSRVTALLGLGIVRH